MPDIGWQELFIIALVTIIVVGPKEIPNVLRTLSRWVRKIKGLARDFQNSIDDLAREAELDDIRKELDAARDFDFEREFEETVDPTGEIQNSIHDLEETMATPPDPVETPGSIETAADIVEGDDSPQDAPQVAPQDSPQVAPQDADNAQPGGPRASGAAGA